MNRDTVGPATRKAVLQALIGKDDQILREMLLSLCQLTAEACEVPHTTADDFDPVFQHLQKVLLDLNERPRKRPKTAKAVVVAPAARPQTKKCPILSERPASWPPESPLISELTDSRRYIAASHRQARTIEARMESARKASDLHKARTGRALRITEHAVLGNRNYEEESDPGARSDSEDSRMSLDPSEATVAVRMNEMETEMETEQQSADCSVSMEFSDASDDNDGPDGPERGKIGTIMRIVEQALLGSVPGEDNSDDGSMSMEFSETDSEHSPF